MNVDLLRRTSQLQVFYPQSAFCFHLNKCYILVDDQHVDLASFLFPKNIMEI